MVPTILECASTVNCAHCWLIGFNRVLNENCWFKKCNFVILIQSVKITCSPSMHSVKLYSMNVINYYVKLYEHRKNKCICSIEVIFTFSYGYQFIKEINWS